MGVWIIVVHESVQAATLTDPSLSRALGMAVLRLAHFSRKHPVTSLQCGHVLGCNLTSTLRATHTHTLFRSCGMPRSLMLPPFPFPVLLSLMCVMFVITRASAAHHPSSGQVCAQRLGGTEHSQPHRNCRTAGGIERGGKGS